MFKNLLTFFKTYHAFKHEKHKNVIGFSCLLSVNSFGTSLDNLPDETIGDLIIKIGKFASSDKYKEDFTNFILTNEIEDFYVFLQEDNAFSSRENFLNALLESCSRSTQAGEIIIQNFLSTDEIKYDGTNISKSSSKTDKKTSVRPAETSVSLFNNDIIRKQFEKLVNNLQSLNKKINDPAQSVHETSDFFKTNDKFILPLANEILTFYNSLVYPVDISNAVNALALNISEESKNAYINVLVNNPFDEETESYPQELFIISYKLSTLIDTLTEILNTTQDDYIRLLTSISKCNSQGSHEIS